ncbi:uncharacterized protein LOC141623423 [Silene latifolia]|uniref:uncharacterized protein LOC141623423 n=1 Tax=Silene latifolia TaxID=37657 RepID=UPI003D77DC49
MDYSEKKGIANSGNCKLPIDLNLCGQEFDDEIVNQYGQLLGDYSKLDGELWFAEHDDNQESMAFNGEGIQWNVESSHSNEHIADLKSSECAHNSLTSGGLTSVESNSSALNNESSQNQSRTFSPVSVLQRRSISNKRARSKHRHPAKEYSRFNSANSMESFALDETIDSCTDNLVRTRKITDLLQLDSAGKNPNPNTMPHLEVAKKCVHCDSTNTPQWRDGPLGRKTLCNACGIQYRKGSLSSYPRPLRIVKPQMNVGKKCLHCESGNTPQWRDGPLGCKTLCNACGLQFKKGLLSADYQPKRTQRFDSPTTDLSIVPPENPLIVELDPALHSSVLDRVKETCSRSRRDSVSVQKDQQSEPQTTHQCCEPYEKREVQAIIMAENTEIDHHRAKKPNVIRDMTWEPSDMLDSDLDSDPDPDFKPTSRKKFKLPNRSNGAVKKCAHCETTKTPQWREGPLGRKTLCNACGVQYRHGRLFPEYRPLHSPTYDPSLHSHLPKKVEKMRLRKLGEARSTSENNEEAA